MMMLIIIAIMMVVMVTNSDNFTFSLQNLLPGFSGATVSYEKQLGAKQVFIERKIATDINIYLDVDNDLE